jgi:hypothetical protein
MRLETVSDGGGWLLGTVFSIVMAVFALGAVSVALADRQEEALARVEANGAFTAEIVPPPP